MCLEEPGFRDQRHTTGGSSLLRVHIPKMTFSGGKLCEGRKSSLGKNVCRCELYQEASSHVSAPPGSAWPQPRCSPPLPPPLLLFPLLENFAPLSPPLPSSSLVVRRRRCQKGSWDSMCMLCSLAHAQLQLKAVWAAYTL